MTADAVPAEGHLERMNVLIRSITDGIAAKDTRIDELLKERDALKQRLFLFAKMVKEKCGIERPELNTRLDNMWGEAYRILKELELMQPQTQEETE